MVRSMVGRSLLNQRIVKVGGTQIEMVIPTVGEILNNEETYYSAISILTSNPKVYKVLLDDNGIDYSKIDFYGLFQAFFGILSTLDLSLLFNNIELNDFNPMQDSDNGEIVFIHKYKDIIIDRLVQEQIADILRRIHFLTKDNSKPLNDHNVQYQIEKERRWAMRKTKQEFKSQLEPMIVALVNKNGFKYDYESVMDLSIYNFNRSFKQIDTEINFNNLMYGVYTGNVDSSKLDKSCLSWMYFDK